MWILFVISIGGAAHPVQINSTEFNNQMQCELAQKNIQGFTTSHKDDLTIFCMRK